MSDLIINSNITLNYDGVTLIGNGIILSTPVTIISTIDSQLTVFLNFTGTITSSIFYIIADSDNLTFDGQNIQINVNTSNYNGLISNTTPYNNIIVKNIIMNATGGSLANGAGWICTSNFSNGTINNCSSSGTISDSGGGILGNNCTNCTVNNCTSSGTILDGSGGIFGGNSNTCTANYCASSGTIENGGGIFGAVCTSDIAYFCNSTGNMIGVGGGIYANDANTCAATNCYSLGIIPAGCGGIYYSSSYSTATNCYSFGVISTDAGGIFGLGVASCTATTCYSLGTIGTSAGGIFGPDVVSCTATSCYSLGNIGTRAGSIFGEVSQISSCINCYALNGTVLKLFGRESFSPTTINSLAENGAGWNDANAISTIGSSNTSWFSTATNTPFILTSFNTNTNIVPIGYQYTFTFPLLSSITAIGTTPYTIINGYVASPLSDTTQVPFDIYGYYLTASSITIDPPPSPDPTPVPCFLEGTKILTNNGYIPIEKLRIGDLVKTVNNDFRKIYSIGYKTLYNNPKNNNCIYHYSKSNNTLLLDDLFITGLHSTLIKEPKIVGSGFTKKIDGYYKLPANADPRASKWNYTGEITIWHIALGNKEYGIFANRMLVESISAHNLKTSNMILKNI